MNRAMSRRTVIRSGFAIGALAAAPPTLQPHAFAQTPVATSATGEWSWTDERRRVILGMT